MKYITCPGLRNHFSVFKEITLLTKRKSFCFIKPYNGYMHLEVCKYIIRKISIMTKYREIIRLTSLGLSQRDIMASCGVAQKLSSKFKSVQKNWIWHGRSKSHWQTSSCKDSSIKRKHLYLLTNEYRILRTSAKSCSAMESVKSFYGLNTWKIAVLTVRNHSCILNSAITSKRMSRNIVPACTLIANPVNRLKLIERKRQSNHA